SGVSRTIPSVFRLVISAEHTRVVHSPTTVSGPIVPELGVNRMPARPLVRYPLAAIVGAAAGAAVFFGFSVLGAVICTSSDPHIAPDPGGLPSLALAAALVVGGPIGATGGIVWAVRRGRRVTSSPPPAPPPAADQPG